MSCFVVFFSALLRLQLTCATERRFRPKRSPIVRVLLPCITKYLMNSNESILKGEGCRTETFERNKELDFKLFCSHLENKHSVRTHVWKPFILHYLSFEVENFCLQMSFLLSFFFDPGTKHFCPGDLLQLLIG